MEPKRRDEIKFRISAMKTCAAQLFANIIVSKLSIDYRIVRRFRIWQQIFLNNVMQGIESKHQNRQLKLKRTILVLLNSIMMKHTQKAFYRWMKRTKLISIDRISDKNLKGALQITAILIKFDQSFICKRLFPLYYATNSSWFVSKRRLAFLMWKKTVIKTLLCESRRESGVIRVFHFLSKKINPIIAHALQRMCKYSGNTLGVRVLSLTLKRIMVDHLYSAILLLKKIKPSVPVKNCNSREKQAKLAFLQRVATFYRLNRLVNKKSKLNPNHMMLFMGFMTWKKLHGHVNLENSMQLFMLAPNQRLIELACIFLGAVYSHQRRNQCANKFSVWKVKSKKQSNIRVLWPIDKNIISNQAKVAASIESQIIARNRDIVKMRQRQKAKNLNFIFKKFLKIAVKTWRANSKNIKEELGNRDVLFDYIRYLEDKLGLPSKVTG